MGVVIGVVLIAPPHTKLFYLTKTNHGTNQTLKNDLNNIAYTDNELVIIYKSIYLRLILWQHMIFILDL